MIMAKIAYLLLYADGVALSSYGAKPENTENHAGCCGIIYVEGLIKNQNFTLFK
jgi:hypothetical protein